MVNLDSIEEYERVNTRYVFLTNQREDLLKAEDTLLEIMNEMDEVMKEEFKITFDKIREEFQKVFKELFNGGQADLKLTNPEDLLTTGIDIVKEQIKIAAGQEMIFKQVLDKFYNISKKDDKMKA